MIEEITMYKTSDGTIFTSFEEAHEHDSPLFSLIESKCPTTYNDDCNAYIIESFNVEKFIIDYWDDIKNIMDDDKWKY